MGRPRRVAHQSPSDPCCDSYMAPVRMTHKPSLSQSVFSTALPLFSARICAVLAKVTPMASACSLPAWEARSLGPRPSWRPGGLLSAPAHATGCTEPRPAAATQPQAAWMLLRPHRGRLPPPLRRGHLGPPLPRPSCLGPPLHRAACALGEDAHRRALGNVVHLAASGGQPRRHDVGARQDEADRAAVHLELGQDVREPAPGWLR